MEFVLVLPVYIAVMGGVLWIGMKSLDAINLRSADHWAVWSEGNRFQVRTPAMLGLRDMFPRSTLVSTNATRRLEEEHSFIQFIGPRPVSATSTHSASSCARRDPRRRNATGIRA